jgi:hypothetical protein
MKLLSIRPANIIVDKSGYIYINITSAVRIFIALKVSIEIVADLRPT